MLKTPSVVFVSREAISHILRLGGNTDEARMKVVAEFSKQKSTEELVAYLQKIYHGGNGFFFDGKPYAVWYTCSQGKKLKAVNTKKRKSGTGYCPSEPRLHEVLVRVVPLDALMGGYPLTVSTVRDDHGLYFARTPDRGIVTLDVFDSGNGALVSETDAHAA